ncbi:hypothetical protein D3C84_893780 [compost metagenome]
MLGEVLDHVVAFGFTVYQHVQPQALLDLHGVANFVAHRIVVVIGRQPALLERLTGETDRARLWKRANGGRRERR